jgi:PHD/YefM family antitoxin component YafN of YafNO toxin-antitoxin module
MIGFHGHYLVDEEGNRKAVVVPISDWEQIVDALEELEDIRAYDDAKGDSTEAIPFEQAISEINKEISD